MKKISEMDIVIRTAAPEDLQEIYRLVCSLENTVLEAKAFEHVFRLNMNHPECFYWVASLEEKMLGFISLHIQHLLHHCGPVGEIQEFYVDTDFRNKGIGRRLMNEVKNQAVRSQAVSLEVTSNKNRTGNISMYESLGFQLTHNKFTL